MEFKYLLQLSIVFFGHLYANYALKDMNPTIETTVEKQYDSKKYINDDFKTDFRDIIRNISKKALLLKLEDVKVDIPEAAMDSAAPKPHSNDYVNENGIPASLDQIAVTIDYSPSQNLNTDVLPTESRRFTLQNYFKRAKRSRPHLSSLIQVTRIEGVEKVHVGNVTHVDLNEILRATASANGLDQEYLAEKIVVIVNMAKTEAYLYAAQGSGYCGYVTISI